MLSSCNIWYSIYILKVLRYSKYFPSSYDYEIATARQTLVSNPFFFSFLSLYFSEYYPLPLNTLNASAYTPYARSLIEWLCDQILLSLSLIFCKGENMKKNEWMKCINKSHISRERMCVFWIWTERRDKYQDGYYNSLQHNSAINFQLQWTQMWNNLWLRPLFSISASIHLARSCLSCSMQHLCDVKTLFFVTNKIL